MVTAKNHDVAVVGGGAMGLAIARALRQRGLAVVLLERGQPGQAASWASAGIVSDPIGNGDEPGFQLQHLSRQLWPAFAQALQSESGLDPEFRETGCLIPAFDDEQARGLDRAVRLGLIGNSTVLRGADLREAEPSLGPAVVAACWKPGGNVENRRLCKALELAARRGGVEIRTGAEVRSIVVQNGRVDGVRLVDGIVPAGQVVIAAGAWSGAIDGCQPAVPVVPQRGQILALDRGAVPLRHTILTPDDPYLVPRADGRIVVGATRELAGWDATPTAGGVAWLLSSAIQIVPALRDCAINQIWTGFRPLSPDGVPIVGPGAIDGLYFVTGHGPSGIGPLPGTVALFTALLFGEPPPIAPGPFDPRRFAQ
ncbi:MAG TPA: FAD-dependent oxidoreductase [Chloroflexota bacterium]|nr:FAD-dependent oxidoreductase [Chloroflexota bacterium]